MKKYPLETKNSWQQSSLEIMRRGNPNDEELAKLLTWLQDYNWPEAPEVALFLQNIGEPLLPHVKEVLKGDDEMWKYWVLSSIVRRWPSSLSILLKDELMKLASLNDEAEVHVKALTILAEQKMVGAETEGMCSSRK